MNDKSYYLCSSEVVRRFPKELKSKPFKSGFRGDRCKYYVALLDFEEVKKSYEKRPNNHFWARECVGGLMEVHNFILKRIKENGLFMEILDILSLGSKENQAMVIYNLACKYNCTPIEFINKIAKSKL